MSITPRLLPRIRSAGLVLAGLAIAAGTAAAQGATVTPAALRDAYLKNMQEVEEKVVGLAEAFTAEQYAWRPGAGVRSVSEVLMHIASEHYVYLPSSLGVKPPADLNMGATPREIVPNLEKVTAKADVIRHLKAAFAFQRDVLSKADEKLAPGTVRVFGKDDSVLNFFNIYLADQHEHLGQLIAYARMNGVVPPWSKKG